MHLFAILTSALLPLGVITTRDVATEASIEALRLKMASIAARDADAAAVGLVERANEHCDIIGVATTVGCVCISTPQLVTS